MASLGDNSLWKDLGSSDVSTDVMGPSYSYADHIQGPSALGVGNNGTMSQLGSNTSAIIQYVKYMVSGPALGNQYFVNTGGSCVAPDGSTQSRFNYINNISNGADLIPETMKQDLGGIATDFNGLIPGMLGDIEGLNPVSLFTSISADSTPACECYSCPTISGNQSKFLTTSLSPDFDPDLCKKVDVSQCTSSGADHFTNQSDTSIPTLIAVVGLVLLYLF